MPENSVDISVSVPKGGISGINVFVPGSTGEVTARDNLAQTYAEWARLWAIKEGDKVNGEDYSSKQYALQSKKSANDAQTNADACKGYAEALSRDFLTYSETFAEQSTEAFEELETAKTEALDEITTAGGGINANEFNALKDDVSKLKDDVNDINVNMNTLKSEIKNKKEVLFSVNKENKTLIISYREDV